MLRVSALMVVAAGLALSGCSTGAQGGPTVRGNVIKIPAGFTGCAETKGLCFVSGKNIKSIMRFEPQTGRNWFLDPGTGNSYFANGDLRSGDPFRTTAYTTYNFNPYANGINLPPR